MQPGYIPPYQLPPGQGNPTHVPGTHVPIPVAMGLVGQPGTQVPSVTGRTDWPLPEYREGDGDPNWTSEKPASATPNAPQPMHHQRRFRLPGHWRIDPIGVLIWVLVLVVIPVIGAIWFVAEFE